MEATMRLPIRICPKAILCFILCLTILCLTFLIDYEEVHAFFPAIIIAGYVIPEAVVAIGGLLAAAGLTWGAIEASDAVTQWYYDDIQPAIRTKVATMVLQTINDISDNNAPDVMYVEQDVWEATKAWADNNFNVGVNTPIVSGGVHLATVSTIAGAETIVDKMYLNYGAYNSGAAVYPAPGAFSIGTDSYEFREASSNNLFILYKNGTILGGSVTHATGIMPTPYLNVNYSSLYGTTIEACVRYTQYGTTNTVKDSKFATLTKDDVTFITPTWAAATGNPQAMAVTGQSVVDTPYDILANDGQTRAIRVGDITNPQSALNRTKDDVVIQDLSEIENPPNTKVTPWSNSWEGSFRDSAVLGEYDFVGVGTATPSIYSTGTWEGVWQSTIEGERVWDGVFTDSRSRTWDGQAIERAIAGEPDATWWERLITGVRNGLAGAIDGASDAITGAIEGARDAIAAGIDSIKENVEANNQDLDPKLRPFKIFDLFVIFFDVLIACIGLVVRACVFLATIVAIPADASLLNSNALAGLNFFRNQKIPVLNVSIWDMFSGLMTLVISLSVVKKVRTTHT